MKMTWSRFEVVCQSQKRLQHVKREPWSQEQVRLSAASAVAGGQESVPVKVGGQSRFLRAWALPNVGPEGAHVVGQAEPWIQSLQTSGDEAVEDEHGEVSVDGSELRTRPHCGDCW